MIRRKTRNKSNCLFLPQNLINLNTIQLLRKVYNMGGGNVRVGVNRPSKAQLAASGVWGHVPPQKTLNSKKPFPAFWHCKLHFICFWSLHFSTFLCFNSFPNKPWFSHVYSTRLLKTLWEKEKLLVTSKFLLFPQRFLLIWKTFCSFHQI